MAEPEPHLGINVVFESSLETLEAEIAADRLVIDAAPPAPWTATRVQSESGGWGRSLAFGRGPEVTGTADDFEPGTPAASVSDALWTFITESRTRWAKALDSMKMLIDYAREQDQIAQALNDPKVLAVEIEGGRIDVSVRSRIARIIAWFFWQMLEDHKAVNYVEFQVASPVTGGVITIEARRPGGRSSHDIRLELEEQIRQYEEAIRLASDDVAQLKADLPGIIDAAVRESLAANIAAATPEKP